MQSRRSSIGIIGAGAIVENCHIPALRALGSVEIAWVTDSNPRRIQKCRQMYGVRGISVDELPGAIRDVDYCLLSTPIGTRHPYYDLIAGAGRKLYVEKPFARTLREHAELEAAFASDGLYVGFNRRFYRTCRELADIVRSELFGQLNRIRVTHGFFSLAGASGFRSDAALAGGGVLIESAIHLLDTAIFASGASEVSFSKGEMLARGGIDYDTVADGVLTVQHGRVPLEVEVTCLRNVPSGIDFFFNSAVVRVPLDAKGNLKVEGPAGIFHIGRQRGYDNEAASVAQSFELSWRACLAGSDYNGRNPLLARDSRLTSKAIGDLYALGGLAA